MDEKTNRKIAVLIPCFDEAMTIGKTVDTYHDLLQGYDFDIYVYDNNSKDRTWEMVKDNPKCVARQYNKIQGKGAVIRKMLRDINADVYIMVDGDGTYPGHNLRHMVAMVADRYLDRDTGCYEHCDMAVGNRVNLDKNAKSRPFHNFGNRLVDALISMKYNYQVTDVMSGLRVMNYGTAKGFAADSVKNGFELETELTLWALNHNKTICPVMTDYGSRPIGSYSKVRTFKDGFRILWLIAKTRNTRKRYTKRT